MKLKWLLFCVPNLLVGILRYPLSVVAVLLFSTPDKRNLTRMSWLMTIDNDLTGDAGWREEHLWRGTNPLSTVNRIRWLWRNGGNSMNYNLLGCDDMPGWRHAVQIAIGVRPYEVRPDGYWVFRKFYELWPGRYLEVFIGWALFGPQHDRCKHVLTIRFRSKTN